MIQRVSMRSIGERTWVFALIPRFDSVAMRGTVSAPMNINKIIRNCSMLFPAIAVLSAILLLCGCGISHSPQSHPAPAKEPSPIRQSVRVAEPEDLKLYIYSWKPGPDGFPQVTLDLRNNLNEDLLVAYAQGSVTVHCGPYAQTGPALVGLRRREVLDPFGSMKLFSPKGGWIELSADGKSELVVPIRLPAGKYELWASFEVAGPNPGVIESMRQTCQID